MSGTVNSLRAVTGVALLALVVRGLPGASEPGEPLLLDAVTPSDTLAAILARDTLSPLVWLDSVAPDRASTALLAAAARKGTAVTLAVPDEAGRLRVEPPLRPVAGRRGALRVSVRGNPDDEIPVTVEGPGGVVDTVRVATGPDGRGAGSLAVEPSREGTAAWTVRAPGATATAHAWVRPAAPVRVLVWDEAPGSESRYLVRALESAGMEVEVRQELGRGLAVASTGASVPRTLGDLDGVDVLVLLGSPSRSVDTLALRWVRERGGGLLLAAGVPASSALAPWAPRGQGREGSGSAITWAGPAEIVPLPRSDVPIRTTIVPGAGLPVARAGDEALARLAHLGRGRLFTSGLETWPWPLRAGLVAEHRAFWESVVEWLAGGLTRETILVAGPALPGTRWEGRFEGPEPTPPILHSAVPGPITEEVLPTSPARPGGAATAFVATGPGLHTLRFGPADPGGDPEVFGVVSIEPSASPGWTAAALEVGAAGGELIAAGPRAGAMGLTGVTTGRSPAPVSRPAGWLLFLAVAGLAVTGWTLRRVRGLA